MNAITLYITFCCGGFIFVPLILLSMVRGIRARLKRRSPKPPRRYVTVPSTAWCKKHVDQWKN